MIACKDCKFYQGGDGHTCTNPALAKPDPIYGSVNSYPRDNREVGGGCGPEAKHFEQKVTIIMKWFVGPAFGSRT